MRDLIPRRELRTMTDRLFGDFWRELEEAFTTPSTSFGITGRKYSYPRLNIRSLDNEYKIDAAIPGLTKDDVQVDYNDGILTISAKSQNEKTEEQNGYIMRELHKSAFSRSLHIDPEICDVTQIEAGVTDGVLTIKIPKKVVDKAEAKRIIEVK